MREPAPGFRFVTETATFREAKAKLQAAEKKRLTSKLNLLVTNPAHPSLEVHPVKPDKHFWEAYLNKGDRIIYVPEGDTLVLVDIVPHDDIDRYAKRPRQH